LLFALRTRDDVQERLPYAHISFHGPKRLFPFQPDDLQLLLESEHLCDQ
jgi:hypothetical protein